jgi:hypothetical protein
MTMRGIEAKIVRLVRSRIPGDKPVGRIECEVCDDSSGYHGTIEVGWPKRKKRDVVKALDREGADGTFDNLLSDLREASRVHSLGPWYRCNIVVGPDGCEFQYFWEGQPYTSIRELEPDLNGYVPGFVLKRRFDAQFVEEIKDVEVNNCLISYVPERLKKKPVTEPLLELFATADWQWDLDHGGMNRYFSLDHEPMTGLARSEFYPRTLRGLRRIGLEAAAAIFAESLALYAHFYTRVEDARQALGVAPLPKQAESDIMGRYGELERSIEPARTAYIRRHIAELEQKD